MVTVTYIRCFSFAQVNGTKPRRIRFSLLIHPLKPMGGGVILLCNSVSNSAVILLWIYFQSWSWELQVGKFLGIWGWSLGGVGREGLGKEGTSPQQRGIPEMMKAANRPCPFLEASTSNLAGHYASTYSLNLWWSSTQDLMSLPSEAI